MKKLKNRWGKLFLVFLSVSLLLLVFFNVSGANIWSSFFSKSSGIKTPPHGGCGTCHMTHNAPGGAITAVNGNANLCMSCHNATGTASSKPFTNAMIAIPGVSGNSHAWNKLSVNPVYETNLTTDPEMLSRVVNDTIICSTCHNQHSQTYPPFLRSSNSGDALCKNCHSVRNIKRYSDNPANKGSHPVGVSYPTSDTRFYSTPQDSMVLVDSNVECTSCHKVHYAATNDGYILRQANDDNLCKSCHTYGNHQGMSCSKCHQTHNTDKTNIYLVKDSISTPSSGIKPVILTDTAGTNSYADGDATFNGVCEVCHTATKFHRNNTSGDHTHYAGMNCITCHPHEDNFLHGGSGDCRECHGHDAGYEYQTGLYCQGKGTVQSHSTHTELDADDQIGPNINCETCHDTTNFPYFKSGTDSNGDSKFDLSETDVCDNCHSSGGLFDGVNDSIVGAKNNWENGIYNGNNLRVGKNNWCAGCHDADRASSNQDGSGVLAPDVAGDSTSYGFYYSGHGKDLLINCTDCHNPRLRHLDSNARTYTYADSIANLAGDQYRTGYRLIKINGLEPMRIPLNDPTIAPFDSANYRLCLNCHSWDGFIDSTVTYSTNFNHSGPNALYSFGYGVAPERNDHLHNHLDFQAHGRVEPYWDSDWDFNTTAIVPGSPNPEVNGYDSYITCVTCHDVHGGKDFGGNTGGNMMRDGRLQGREPGLKFTYMIEASGGLPMVTSVGANEDNSIGGVIRSGVNYRAGYYGTPSNTICGGCHKEVYPTTDEYNATGNGGNGCTPCHPFSTSSSYYMEYYRTPTITDCNLCHSQPPDGTSFPNTAGSHQTHMSSARGPHISDCSVCHASADSTTHMNQIVSFASGTDSNGNGNIELSETDVCDNCHSPGGTYDGVNDPVIGAKNNWANGVYTGNNLTTGKEKWCAGCHDESPANSKADSTGVSAPNVIGNESANARYGTGYGYYKTGHGLPANETYPASGGVTAGAGLDCGACHDYSLNHIDNIQRTFDDGDSITSPGLYTSGYRLKLIGGLDPMQIPLPQNTVPLNNSDQFRLCYSCHDSGPFLSSSNMNTNLVTDGVNRHEYHLHYNQLRYASDWNGANNSRITCVTCHNVHGSDRMTMVRDGKLINSEPGLQIWYNNDAIVSYNTSNPDPPNPENLQLSASTGTVWIGNSSSNLCSHCHGNGNTTPEYRTPFQDVNIAPWLEWVGDLDFENDGVTPDTAYAGNDFLFRVNYFDSNNDFPSIYQLLVDTNGNGITDSVNMNVQVGDNNFTDGSVYSATVNIAKPAGGPGNIDYRFYFISTDSVATGAPASNHQFYVRNNPPVLDWTGNLFFETDGVHPNVGPAGNFDFEIVYTDVDGDIPSTMNLIIDDVLPGYTMTAGSGSITSGKTYTATVALSNPGDHTYRFVAVDNATWGDTATLESGPITNNTFTVTSTANHIPTLDYVNGTCFTNSVMPARGPIDGDYDFQVVYTDLDNDTPTVIKVIIDGVDEYPLTAIGGNILTGKTYGTTIQINTTGYHSYYFYANDGQDTAIGPPTILNGDTLSVINAAKVKLNDTRVGWYGSIQAAIDDLSDTTIMVYPATYNERLIINSSSSDDKLTIEAVCGPDNTIIDSTGNTVFIQNIPTYTKIIGFTITGGTNGIYINNGKPEIVNCIIRNNDARGINSANSGNILTITNTIVRDNNVGSTSTGIYGAGIFFNGGTSHVISGCTIIGNHASERGGGIYAQNITTGNLTIISTEISNNISDNAGGGIGVNAAHIVIDKCKIMSNTVSGTGVAGGLFAQGTNYDVDIKNSIFANNSGKDGGAFWFNSNMNVTIANTVFEGNTTSDTVGGRGGALFTYDSDPVITNCIFWNNTAGSNYQMGHDCYAHQSGSVFTITYSDLVNNGDMLSGAGTFNVSSCIGSDPQFTDAVNGDYSLKPVSPCIDLGTSTGAPADDINGHARGVDGRGDGNVTGDFSDYDIGAYEYVP